MTIQQSEQNKKISEKIEKFKNELNPQIIQESKLIFKELECFFMNDLKSKIYNTYSK